MTQIGIGEKAHNFVFASPWDGKKDFFTETKNQRSLLLFLRYFGCTTCQLEIHNLILDYPKFKQAGVEVYVVLQSSAATITSELKQEDIPFVLVLDPEQTLYKAYGIGSRDPDNGRTLEHQARVQTAKTLGFTHGKYEGNELQLPATFIIGPEHIVEYAYYGKESSDIPEHNVLIKKIGDALA
ncbi:peroxiredoxin-like family protein [Sodalis sp. RH22]|uniref:peroxiredoxin-like family protein n=1 Tax=unclassified Sodalis (in: enterobacteria) TaxID=2636512 RepID=UPI0039B4C6D6